MDDDESRDLMTAVITFYLMSDLLHSHWMGICQSVDFVMVKMGCNNGLVQECSDSSALAQSHQYIISK